MADCIYIRLYVLSIAVLVTVLSPPRCAAADAGSIKLPKKIAVIAKSDDIRGPHVEKGSAKASGGAFHGKKGTEMKPGAGTGSAVYECKMPVKAKRLSVSAKHRLAYKKSSRPFIRGHYVLGPYLPIGAYRSQAPTVVVVDKGSHFTYVLQLQNGKVVRVYTMSNAVGKGDTPTPPGRYLVRAKEVKPWWVPPAGIDRKQKPVPPYNLTHRNPLGVAAIYLNKFGVLLHGTNNPSSIRQSVSHGCVRHSNKDISRLYGMVKPGTVVYVVNRFRGKVLNVRDFKA